MKRRELLKATGISGAAGFLVIELYSSAQKTTRGLSDDEKSDEPTDADEPDDNDEPGRGSDTPRADRGPDTSSTDEPDPDSDNPPDDRNSDVPHADEFETVVDAVAEGADPDGDEPVNFLFEEYADDRTLLAFEPGTYQIDYFTVSGNTHLGVAGTGDEPATFVPAEGNCRGGHPWVFFDDVTDFLLENVTFDFRGADSGGPLHLFLGGDSAVRDVAYLGTCSNQLGVIRVAVRDESGTALFDGVEARNVDENQTLTGVYVSDGHAGKLTFRDCALAEFSDNGLYASAPGGPEGRDGAVHVVGGTYENSNIANVRLGSTGSRAEDVTVVVDSETPGWGQLNARGIRLRNKSGQVIENCDITFGERAPDSFGGVVFHRKNGGGLVRDTSITIHRDSIPAIRAFPVDGTGDGAMTFENLSITGSAAAGVTARIEGRDGTVFDGCTVEQTGDGRRGLRFVDCADCRIVDSRLDVTEAPVAVENGTVAVENCTIRTRSGRERIESRTLEDETLEVA